MTALLAGGGGAVDHAYLEITRDGQRQLIALDSDRLTIGRAEGNDLRLAAENTVSGSMRPSSAPRPAGRSGTWPTRNEKGEYQVAFSSDKFEHNLSEEGSVKRSKL